MAEQITFSAPAPLAEHHHFEKFDCGEPALDRWLQNRARSNESRFARTYVSCVGNRVAGYYCILASSIGRSLAPRSLSRNAPDPLPISVIGRLAVDIDYAGKGLGKGLLLDAFRRIATVSQTIGVSAVLVQAKNENAKTFYLAHAAFIEWPRDSRTLYLPIETVIAAL
jgi:GNAT superfamily N-acetyltransferase